MLSERRIAFWLVPVFALMLVLVLLWQSLTATRALRIDVGEWGDHAYLKGINGVERSSTESYRWTEGQTTLTLPNLSGRYRLLRMRAHGWRPEALPSPQLQLAAGDTFIGAIYTTPKLRVYHVLLPPPADPQLQIRIASELYFQPGDVRKVGVALDWIELGGLGRAGPGFWQLGGQTLLLALAGFLGMALRAQAPQREVPKSLLPRLPVSLFLWFSGFVGIGAVLLLWANHTNPLLVAQALPHWFAVLVLLLALHQIAAAQVCRWLLPWMSMEQARGAWAIFTVALGLRLLGAVHPLFNTHDVDVHMRWLATVDGGQLYLYSTPGELRNRQTFNPPAGYLLLLPLWLVLDSSRLVTQVGVALIDGLGCLLLLPIARELRLGPRAALVAMALAIALPITTTMLWWGFATNTIAQATWLLLLWLLLRLTRMPSPKLIAVFVVVCAVNLLMHAGALVLVVTMLGAYAVFGWRTFPKAGRRAVLAGVGLALLFTVPIYFMAAAGPILTQNGSASPLDISASLAKGWNDRFLRLELIRRGLVRGYLPLLLGLAPIALLWLATHRAPPRRAALVVAWMAISVLFFGVYMGLNFQTRYIYFAAPLVSLALGALLAQLWQRRGGRIIAVAIALYVVWAGTMLWFGGALLRIKPSILPLTQ